jgi:hypothetical protein
LLVSPATVTDTYPCGTAPLGTVATMPVLLQLVAAAVVPLKFTVLVPCVAPKFVPVIVTAVPTAPDAGDRLDTVGGVPIWKDRPLLVSPATVTDTYPCGTAPLGTAATMPVLLQLVAVAVVPLKFTVLVPCVAPKFVPVIVTAVPTAPDVGDRLDTVGGVPI